MALLDAAPLLLDRLKERCASATGGVRCEDDLAGVLANAQRDRSLYLVLADYWPHLDDGAEDAVWREIWFVVVVVKQVSQAETWQRAFANARPLLADVCGALHGWRHRPEIIGRVLAQQGPKPKVADGFVYLPLAFAVDTAMPGDGGY